jgi:hypothetical protein
MPPPHPVLRLMLQQPELLTEHAAGYAALLMEDGRLALAPLQRRWRYTLLGWLALALGLGLLGQVALLWAWWGAVPPSSTLAAWLPWLVPALPLVLGAWALWKASQPAPEPAWANTRRELAVDLALLRATAQASTP